MERPGADLDLSDYYGPKTWWYDYIGVVFLVASPFIGLVIGLIYHLW